MKELLEFIPESLKGSEPRFKASPQSLAEHQVRGRPFFHKLVLQIRIADSPTESQHPGVNRMKAISRFFKYGFCLFLGVVAECFAFFASVRISPCGFGGSTPQALFLFPYFWAFSRLGDSFAMVPVAIASMIQYPAYGWVVGKGWVRGKLARYAVALALAHGCACLAGAIFGARCLQ
jgi:hypothetical protein